MNLDFFPPLNATLNGIAGIFLIAGFIQIKRGNRKGHAACMISALAVSAIFLVCYVTSKVLMGKVTTRFPEEYPTARVIYLTILFTHIPLAIGMLPLIFIAVRHAIKGNFEKHRRMVRWAYPIWLYVSITGVIVYFMLYQWFLPSGQAASTESAVPVSIESTIASSSGGALTFSPEVFEYEADEGESEMTATFVARNTGTAPVKLTKLDSSCSCLSVDADIREIPPGETATITAIFDIEKLTGEAEKSIYVTSDAPEMKESRLAVRVTIPAVIAIEPMTVKWAVGESPESREIIFRVLRDKPIRVTEIKSSRDSVAAVLETVEEGREYRILVTPTSTSDSLLGFVRITTDCELEQYRQHMAYYAVQNGPSGK
ncbi:MAG: DUF420 domain-containing protein [Verrucomicrobiae bacterium]|nr:DUF420 domain-containing protein [Verrucomicrobiae bacterium]